MREERISEPTATTLDLKIEGMLRPQTFGEFVGQQAVIENLKVYVQAARNRGDVLDHILISGPPGAGQNHACRDHRKRAWHRIEAYYRAGARKAGGPRGDTTNLTPGAVLFIDEIHRLGKAVEEYLYAAMEDFRLDIVIDSGASARSVRLELAKFTLIGSTTREGLLTSPFRARFGASRSSTTTLGKSFGRSSCGRPG